MPRDAVVVYIVQDRQAGLRCSIDVELCIVWLAGLLVAGLGPGVEAVASGHPVSGRHLAPVGRPEPSVDVLRFKITSVFTTFEVTKSARCPNVWDVVWK